MKGLWQFSSLPGLSSTNVLVLSNQGHRAEEWSWRNEPVLKLCKCTIGGSHIPYCLAGSKYLEQNGNKYSQIWTSRLLNIFTGWISEIGNKQRQLLCQMMDTFFQFSQNGMISAQVHREQRRYPSVWNEAVGTALLLFQSSLQKVVLLSTCHFLFSSSPLHALYVLLIPSLFDLYFYPSPLLSIFPLFVWFVFLPSKVNTAWCKSHFQTQALPKGLQRWAEAHLFSF